MDLALLVLRLVIGLLFVGHGCRTLFGVLGVPGAQRTGDSFEAVGLRPARLRARAAGTAETAGGAMLSFGLLGIHFASTGWALAALGAGVIAGLGAVISGRLRAARHDRATPPHPA